MASPSEAGILRKMQYLHKAAYNVVLLERRWLLRWLRAKMARAGYMGTRVKSFPRSVALQGSSMCCVSSQGRL